VSNVIIGNPGILNGSWEVNYQADPRVGLKKSATLDLTIAAQSVSTDEDNIISNTPGLPLLYGFYGGMWCKRITLKDIGGGQHPLTHTPTRFWMASCQFDSETDTNSSETNPLFRPVVITRDSTVVDEQIFLDAITGDPIVTAAGEPMYLTAPTVMPVFTFTRFEPYPYPDAQILNLTNATNLSAFRGAPSGTALMLKIRTNEVTIKNVRYEQVSYTIQFKINRYNPSQPNTWAENLPHVGTFYKDGDRILNVDRDGVARGTIYHLNPNGTKRLFSDPVDYRTFNRMRKVNFPIL
jgi:hypothetical protein